MRYTAILSAEIVEGRVSSIGALVFYVQTPGTVCPHFLQLLVLSNSKIEIRYAVSLEASRWISSVLHSGQKGAPQRRRGRREMKEKKQKIISLSAFSAPLR